MSTSYLEIRAVLCTVPLFSQETAKWTLEGFDVNNYVIIMAQRNERFM